MKSLVVVGAKLRFSRVKDPAPAPACVSLPLPPSLLAMGASSQISLSLGGSS